MRTIPETFTGTPEFCSEEDPTGRTGGDQILNGQSCTGSSPSDYSSLDPDLGDLTMNFSSDLSLSEEYQSFRSTVPLKKVAVDSDSTKVNGVSHDSKLILLLLITTPSLQHFCHLFIPKGHDWEGSLVSFRVFVLPLDLETVRRGSEERTNATRLSGTCHRNCRRLLSPAVVA